jgi:hypothetical protein
VLLTRKAVPHELKLAIGGAAPPQHCQFRPYFVSETTGVAIGECEASPSVVSAARAVLEVHRGRVGGKAPERLVMLERLTPEMLRWPAVRWQGKLKAAEAMLREWNWQSGSYALLWLALKLALHEAALKTELKAAADAFGEKTYGLPAHVVRSGAWLAWGPQLDAAAEKLPAVLLQRRTANPLRDELDLKTAARLLALQQPELADEVLRRFSKLGKLSTKHDRTGGLRLLLGERYCPALRPDDAAVVRKIEALYEAGEGLPVALLRAQFPSHQHVIQWMLDAGRLVATAEGYIFTRQQLRLYLSKLPTSRVESGMVGVREIKDTLGLPRRAAEALRAYLVAEYGSAVDTASDPRPGRDE